MKHTTMGDPLAEAAVESMEGPPPPPSPQPARARMSAAPNMAVASGSLSDAGSAGGAFGGRPGSGEHRVLRGIVEPAMTQRIRRGDVRPYSGASGSEAHLVVVLARDGAIPFLPEIMVAPVTTVILGLPSEVVLGTSLGLRGPAAASLDAVRTVSKSRLGDAIGELDPVELRSICRALRVAVGCDVGDFSEGGAF